MAKGFGGFPGGNIQAMMQQAQKMKQKLEQTQEEVKNFVAQGSAGGGAVKITMSGEFETNDVQIDESVIDPKERELLQDTIRAALNDCVSKIKAHKEEAMSKVTGGMNIPGLF